MLHKTIFPLLQHFVLKLISSWALGSREASRHVVKLFLQEGNGKACKFFLRANWIYQKLLRKLLIHWNKTIYTMPECFKSFCSAFDKLSISWVMEKYLKKLKQRFEIWQLPGLFRWCWLDHSRKFLCQTLGCQIMLHETDKFRSFTFLRGSFWLERSRP